MKSSQRIALLAIAAVVLVGGFVVAQSAGEDGEERAAAPATTAAGTATDTEAAPSEPAPKPAPRVETIRIRDRAPVGDPPTLRFDSGETVRLRFRSNVAEEVHVHGYDKYVDVPAGGTATARFKATAEGIFEVESHGSGELLAKLQIEP